MDDALVWNSGFNIKYHFTLHTPTDVDFITFHANHWFQIVLGNLPKGVVEVIFME